MTNHRRRQYGAATTTPNPVAKIAHWKLGDVLALALVVSLITFSRQASLLSVAGVPIVVVLLLALLIGYRGDLKVALASSRTLRIASGMWLAWALVTLARAAVDYPTYGTLALRDAVVTFCFAGVPLGGAIAVRAGEEAIRRALKPVSLVLAFYMVVSVAPISVPGFTGFHNAGVAGVALFAAGLWGRGFAYRTTCILSSVFILLLYQGRMMYLVVGAVVALYLIIRQRGAAASSSPSGASRVLVVAGTLFAVGLGASLLTYVPGLGGRVTGDTSLTSAWALVESVFQDDPELSGSRQDREDWWASGFARLSAEPQTLVTGLGLGPDLANGFSTGDGTLVRKPHNDYLEALFRTGVLAAIALVTSVVAGLASAARLVSRSGEWGLLLGWMLGAASNAFAQPYFAYPHGAIPLAICAGIAMVAVGSDPAPAPTRRRSTGRSAIR